MPVPSWETELKEVAPNVFAYIQGGGPGIDNASVSNAGLIIGDDYSMVIDALTAPVLTKAFIAAMKKVNPKPFRHLVNTHHHYDHTRGNCFFLPIEIVAHEKCREAVIEAGMPYPTRPDWQEGVEGLKLTPPTTTFTDKMTYRYGDIEVQLLYQGPAHTQGDILVYLPRYKVLFAGDVAFHYVAPHFWQGHGSGLLRVLDWIADLDVETIVPGHGPLGAKKEIAEMREYVEALRKEAKKRFDAGMNAVEASVDINMGRFDEWPNATERVIGNVMRFYLEFQGKPLAPISQDEIRRARETYLGRKVLRPKP
ncbi:MAG: MBL fold metallo-hydrolase [Deltaproteobacteria bacterium]|nr:MBL fold metallo-hydrolase [Deltaproteobacteria bacterium]